MSMDHFIRLRVADWEKDYIQRKAQSANMTLTEFVRRAAMHHKVNVLIGTEIQVDFIGIINRFLSQCLADQRRQISAHFAAQRQLSVGKSTRSRKTGSDVTKRLAVHTFFRFGLRAVTVFNRLSFFHNDNFLFTAEL